MSVTQEWNWEFASCEVKSAFNEVDAALMPLKIVQSEQKIDFVVFKHSEWTLDSVTCTSILAFNAHVREMDSSQNSGTTDTDGHASESRVE